MDLYGCMAAWGVDVKRLLSHKRLLEFTLNSYILVVRSFPKCLLFMGQSWLHRTKVCHRQKSPYLKDEWLLHSEIVYYYEMYDIELFTVLYSNVLAFLELIDEK